MDGPIFDQNGKVTHDALLCLLWSVNIHSDTWQNDTQLSSVIKRKNRNMPKIPLSYWILPCLLTSMVFDNGNRIEWSPTLSLIKQVINKIAQLRGGSLICLSRVRLLTELDNKKFFYQLIITILISKNTNTPRTNISSGDNLSFVKYSPILEIALFFFG